MRKYYLILLVCLAGQHLTAQKEQKIFPLTAKKQFKAPRKDAGSPAIANSTLAAGCDTINYPIPDAWAVTYYAAGAGGNGGFVTGNNMYGDKEKAAYFNVSSSADVYLTKVWIAFAVANSNRTANLTKTVPIKIYDGTGGQPGNLLATANKLLSDLHGDAAGDFYSEIVFPGAVYLPASKKFFVSVDVSNLSWSNAGGYDSLAVYSNRSNQTVTGANGFGWEKNNNSWNTLGAGWNTDLSLIIHPFLSTNSSCVLSLPTSVRFSGKVYLQGAYNANSALMNNTLNSMGILQANAASQPYNITGFNYQGTENVPAGFFAGHPEIVDWVLIELHDASAPTTVVASRAVFVRQDGNLVETDGTNTYITFQGVAPGDYYVAIRHRNHLGVRSAYTIDLSSGTGTYDFTASLDNAFTGSVSNPAMATLTAGVYGLWAGNANDDLQVKMTGLSAASNDYLRLLSTLGSSINSVNNVYSRQDLNMDGRINMTGLSPANNDYLKLLNTLGSSINSITQPAF